ncbi:MAG: PEP-CTERM sorting domain-containing protein [Sphaerospermopsis sp. SIO1G1]|nr:PEP-CTERM sorting domain-containing protein [Sphaerospermopsis sp. SIO1G1]
MFNLRSKLLGATLSLPVVAAGLLGATGSASAAVLTGTTAYSGIGEGIFSPVTSVMASDGSLDFSDPNLVGLAEQTGSFTSFGAATIYDISPIPGTFGSEKLFLDFGADQAGLTDGKNVFKATKVSDYSITHDGAGGSSISLAFHGFFYGEDETEKSSGYVNLNFTSLEDVATTTDILLNNGAGTGITTIATTFSGMAAAKTPEPTTMLGLGLVASGMMIARRRKAVQA